MTVAPDGRSLVGDVVRLDRLRDADIEELYAAIGNEQVYGAGFGGGGVPESAEAMRAVAERSTIKELRSFCLAMVQADQLGIPVARVLRVQSKEMRVKRRQRAEEKAQQVPVKIMVPLVLFVLPCLLIVIGGPAVLQVMDSFR